MKVVKITEKQQIKTLPKHISGNIRKKRGKHDTKTCSAVLYNHPVVWFLRAVISMFLRPGEDWYQWGRSLKITEKNGGGDGIVEKKNKEIKRVTKGGEMQREKKEASKRKSEKGRERNKKASGELAAVRLPWREKWNQCSVLYNFWKPQGRGRNWTV